MWAKHLRSLSGLTGMNKANDKAVEVNKLTKRFGEVTAVNRITFIVRKGEIFGFLGPNGAGKTTTIRMLTGLLTPDSGDVAIEGIDIRKNLIKVKMKMGVIPEMGSIYGDLTASQNIVLAGRFYGIGTRELKNRAGSLLERFALHDRRRDLVKTFSKGMKQRVNIASAIVHNPDLLFLDEPTSGLDVQSRRLIREIIKEMNQKGTTIFLSTHNIEEANILCERVGIINKGEIAAINTPEKLKTIFEQTRSVEISMDRPIDNNLIEKSGLVKKIDKLGDKLKLYTNDPDKLVKYLVKLAQDKDATFTSMQMCGTRLEDVFVKLTEK
jgi:ABC-2 type transport system ATP-binding protein